MPNTLAYVALFAYPLVAILLFRRLGLVRGLIWTILGGYLFLPVQPVIDLPIPGLPFIDKVFVPAICALILAGSEVKRQMRKEAAARRRQKDIPQTDDFQTTSSTRERTRKNRRKGRWLINLLLLGALIGPVITTLTNGEPLIRGGHFQAGFQLYDSGRAIVTALVMLIPFFLARKYLNTTEAHMSIVWALVIAGVAYSILALYEVRMAPVINRNIYGFFAHDWRQHLRRGGYRPIIFLEHGLRVGVFLAICTIAVSIMVGVEKFKKHRAKLIVSLVFFIAVLWMAKSLGAAIIAVVFVPMAFLQRVKIQVLFSAILAAVILLYPVLRGGGFIPVDQLLEIAQGFDVERAESLGTRLKNEDILLNHASQKPVAGWGGQGRWLVFDDAGNRESIPDGIWVVTIGQFGWLGYLSRFGLLSVPLLLLAFRNKSLGIDRATAGLALILAANMVDLIPNSALTPITWLIAGSLAGWYETQMATRTVQASAGARKTASRKTPAAAAGRRHARAPV